jgi:transcriptional regulator with GAF, ATPase, and Fis domain
MAPIDRPPSSVTPPDRPSAALEDIDIKAELMRRPYRSPDYEAENRALVQLAQAMAEHPSNILQSLVDIAYEVCRADSAGLSLLEMHQGQSVCRWEAVTGRYAGLRNHTMPRDGSPCGTTVDHNISQLMYMPERVFPALKADPPVVEALLLPFSVEGQTIGTIWVVAHDDRRRFDAEDERLVTTLATFASAAWQLWTVRAMTDAAKTALEEKVAELEHFHDMVVNRELKMIDLEKENASLKQAVDTLKGRPFPF